MNSPRAAHAARRRVVEATGRKPPAKLRSVHVIFEPDPDADASYLQHDGLEERLADYERGAFDFVWVHADAEVVIEGVVQRLTSGGMHAIESDSEDEYLAEIVAEQWATLRNVLKAVGVATEQLPLDAQREWVEWRI